MSTGVQQSEFTKGLLSMITEVFESVRGYFLDSGTSLFETLAEISTEEASILVGGKCATIAAQTAHVNFYIETLEHFLTTGQNQPVDWGEVWRTVRKVTPEEWTDLQERLRQSYERIRALIENYNDWQGENSYGGAIALVAHTAYHLGEIRQATCTIKP